LSQLLIGQILGLQQEDVFVAFEQWIVPHLILSDLVHRFVDKLDNMEPFKHKGCFRKVLLDVFDKGRRHVAGHLFDMLRTGFMLLQICTEALEYIMVPNFNL
jgi:hypothetical protein